MSNKTRLCALAAGSVLSTLALVPLTSGQALAASTVRISSVQFDSPGSDNRSNSSLNAEWVRIHNYGTQRRTLTGWTLRDTSRHVYRFPSFSLAAGASVRVHTGRGTNSATNLYWGSRAYIWNNTGDKATLENTAGTTMSTRSWKP